MTDERRREIEADCKTADAWRYPASLDSPRGGQLLDLLAAHCRELLAEVEELRGSVGELEETVSNREAERNRFLAERDDMLTEVIYELRRLADELAGRWRT